MMHEPTVTYLETVTEYIPTRWGGDRNLKHAVDADWRWREDALQPIRGL